MFDNLAGQQDCTFAIQQKPEGASPWMDEMNPKTMDFTPSAIINTGKAAATALEFRFLIKPEKEPAKRSGRKLPAPRADRP